MNYQRKNLADDSNVGSPQPLPAELVGLTDTVLADLSAFVPLAADELGYAGQGFFPVADPPSPAPARFIHKSIFLQRLSPATRIAIRAASETDPLIEDFLDVLYATDEVDLDNANTTAGVDYMVSEGLLTSDQAAALLA